VLSLHASDADRVPIADQQRASEINPIRNDDRMGSVVRRTKGDRIETFRLLSIECVSGAVGYRGSFRNT
jgi:hypothetical protein